MASRSVYCICGEPYDSSRFMIQCDSCKDWYHGSCVDIKEHESMDIEKYHCAQCQLICGPSLYREIKNWHRHNYADPDADGKAVQTGTPVFVKELRSRHFPSADEVIIRLRGQQLSLPLLMQNGFNFPIVVDSKIGLGLQMPSDSFIVGDVMDYIGPDYLLDVIDVTRQENIKMTMKEWVEYFNSPVRNKVYNVISLEFSKTRLSELIKPPTIVQKLSWVENYWPKSLPENFPHSCPQVMKYCLMSAQDSFTDFHIDFGGTSVWYHILRGEKIFYLIRPTAANLSLYEHWMASSNQSETFFGDQVDVCYQLTLGHGQTLFIPTGWIHAVLTPVDSLVFGGNFLHSFNIPLQLQVHEMEKRISTPEKFKFPCFEILHWFAAPHLLEQLKDFNLNKRGGLSHLVAGTKALITVLKSWSADTQNHKLELIPFGLNITKLIKDLQREARFADKFVGGKNSLGAVTRKTPNRQRKQKETNVLVKNNQCKVSEIEKIDSSMESPTRSSSTLKFSLKPRLKTNPDSANQCNQAVSHSPILNNEAFQSDIQVPDDLLNKLDLPFKMVLPVANSLSLKGGTVADRNDNLRLKVSHGKLLSKEEMIPGLKNDSIYDFVDSDDDNLVVDENPPSNKRPKISDLRKQSKAREAMLDSKSALKLRLSVNGKLPEDGFAVPKEPSTPTNQDDANADAPKNATIDDLLVATGLAVDPDNSSISLDDDELSGGRTSPSTREAIQGMLSISKSAFLFPNQADSSTLASPPATAPSAGDISAEISLPLTDSSLSNFSILAKKSTPPVKLNSFNSKMSSRQTRYNDDDDDFEESLKQCHQDGDFIYLGLEASDDEFHVFKPRGRSRRDEPWNPKAKLVPNCPKPERPVREGVRKEAIECGLAAAAAKLANMPPPKRQYLKKKPVNTKSKESYNDQHPGPSTSVNWGIKRQFSSEALMKVGNKKPKKGFATAKQRLGKILKIHKMLY